MLFRSDLIKKEIKDKCIIAFIEEVQGDEEFPECIKGMVLQREIPLLSHLAIRIRQSGVVCCACKNIPFYNKLKGMVKEGQEFEITLSSGHIDLKPACKEKIIKENSKEVIETIEQSPTDLSLSAVITSFWEADDAEYCTGTNVN